MKKTALQIEKEIAAKKAEALELERELEAAKQAEIGEMKEKREKGIRDAWGKVTQEMVKAGMAEAPKSKTDKGQKIAESRLNRTCYELLGEVLGMKPAQDKPKNKTLNDDQKAKIEEWVKEGLSVAEMNRKIYTNPSQTSYQRVSKYVKKLKG